MLGTEFLNPAMVQLNSFIQNKENFVSLQKTSSILVNFSTKFVARGGWCFAEKL